MDSVSLTVLDDLGKKLEKMLDEFPEARAEFHERAGKIMKQTVDESISQTVQSGSGKLQGWQRLYVGSAGGYAAVRPVGAKDGFGPGPNSPGSITRYVNNGHKVRGFAKKPHKNPAKYRYYPHVTQSSVSGKYFYQQAQSAIEGQLINEAERFLQEFAGEIT